ncbi:hypothetical protein OCU04_004572 [Sclerotinia nivalis]|uniref:Uncharacterized protein n=1 Tax=Sclerotinia nivalis TaxID=352851 RepID=A0A9X0AQP7_9HELO|nr:hypothetical protein OCU04_004572 [Sclerotinia nivalis]
MVSKSSNLSHTNRILEAIKLKRTEAFTSVFAALKSFSQRGIEPKSYCMDPFDICDLITTGSFLKSASLNGYWPIPETPYIGMTLEALFQKVSKIKARGWCDTTAEDHLDYTAELPDPDCINREMFVKMKEVQIKGIKESIVGLEIEQFQHKLKEKKISLPISQEHSAISLE